MAKPKSPLLSLGAEGTIGDALTYQKRGQLTIVRKKPIPGYRRTLPQLYQRWLYEDYAYLWTKQTEATKRQYAADGVRFHLTGFQYWMKYQLTNLPDIAGWWKLDDNTGATTPDSSRNNNTGTIFGAVPATGPINGALDFDGINDYVNCGLSPTLRFTSSFAFMCFVIWHLDVTGTTMISSQVGGASGYFIYVSGIDNLRWGCYGLTPALGTILANPALDTLYHIGISYDHQNHFIHPYLNGDPLTPVAVTGTPIPSTSTLCLARYGDGPAEFHEGILDNAIIFNRHLDDTEFKRHSERRYPE